MISENLCHSSKVWTKEFDLDDMLIKETGEVDKTGKFKYDNLPGYKYVDVTYDTYGRVKRGDFWTRGEKKGYKIGIIHILWIKPFKISKKALI